MSVTDINFKKEYAKISTKEENTKAILMYIEENKGMIKKIAKQYKLQIRYKGVVSNFEHKYYDKKTVRNALFRIGIYKPNIYNVMFALFMLSIITLIVNMIPFSDIIEMLLCYFLLIASVVPVSLLIFYEYTS